MLNAYSIKVKLILTLLITTLVTPIGLLIYFLLIENQAHEEQQQQLVIKKEQQEKVFFFENSLNNAYSDILYINRIVQHKIDSHVEKNTFIFDKDLHASISFNFKSFLEVNPLYQQIRLIDSNGQELIRLNRQQGQVISTSTNKLQNKSEYAYVSESLKLQTEEIYTSELGLNRENGIIETPYNPTLRIAIKLDDIHSGFKGIIVINISAQQIIDEIIKDSKDVTYLINQQGDYIVHPQTKKQWSTELAHHSNFNDEFSKPNSWLQSPSIQNNVFTPLKTSTQRFYISPINSNSQFSRHWFLITAIPTFSVWKHLQQQTELISSAIISIFLSILLGSYISKCWFIQPIRYMENISQRLIEGKSIESTNSCSQKDELSSLCSRLHQMAKIISSNHVNKELVIETLNDEIARRKEIEQDLSIYKALFEYSSEAMMITDQHEIITHINPAYTLITGFSKNDVIGQTPRIISSGKQDTAFYKKLWHQLNTLGFWQGELINRRKNGDIYPVHQCINSIQCNDKTSLYISVFSDITQHKEFEETLKQHAYYDPLTSLPNRKLLQDRLNQTIAKMYRHGQYAALLFLDLDNFKYINDSLGHSFGDDLLKKVATRLKSNFREIDSISRFGGDEFVILINDLSTDKEKCHELVKIMVNKLLKLLAKPYFIKQQELFISSSIGISVFPTEKNHTPEDIIKMADIAMYAAKNEGKGTFQFYHPDMQEKAHQRLYIENGLREAIKQNQLISFYQGQYTANKQLIGFEALIRWHHPEIGLIPPNDFIPIAEESMLINEIGETVIWQACLQIKQWKKQGHNIPHIAVNISPKQFAEKDFVEKVRTICHETNTPPKQLMLELTEATIISNIENTIEKMSQLQKLGYQISIDDFGTGYSSLAYLNKFPINQLKIDKSFIDAICLENKDVVIVDTIIAMAQHLKLNLIAEGVENQFQVDYLKSKGCMGYQGYYFCKPVPGSEIFHEKIKQGELC